MKTKTGKHIAEWDRAELAGCLPEDSWDAGYLYAHNCPSAEVVDIAGMLGSTVDMPPDDFTWLKQHGIKPNSREYWTGYNRYITDYIRVGGQNEKEN
jgi:hypothetical protein